MAYDPDQGDAVSRVRFLVGDVTDPSLMPGGESVYEALLASYSDDEADAARAAARGLAAYYATQPDSVSSAGESVSWRSRVDQWNRIALGGAGGAASASSPLAFVPVTYRDTSSADEYGR